MKKNYICDRIDNEKRDKVLNIENVKGIIIAPNGTFKSFGVHSDDELDEMNFHDSSFKIDLANSSWFKRLKKECNIDYINNVCASAIGWTSNGIITMINAGTKEMEAYCMLMPMKISIKQKRLLEKNYENIKNQIQRNDAFFEGYIFGEDGNLNLSSPIYSQDILYDFLGMSIKKSKVKK